MARLFSILGKESLAKALASEPKLVESLFEPQAVRPPHLHSALSSGPNSTQLEDWSHTITFTPETILRPASEEQLLSLLAQYAPSSFSVLGSLHSSSRIFQNDHVVVDVTGMPLKLEWSPDFVTVTVSTNMPLREFLIALARQGRSLPATGGTDEQTLAGVMATNTAPATKYVTMYSGVKSIKYVTFESGQPAIKTVAVDSQSPFIPNLGALGVLLEVVIETVPDQYFYTIQKISDVNTLLSTLTYTDGGYDYPFWRIDWVPERQDGLVWAARPITMGPGDDPDGDYATDYVTTILKKVAFFHNNTPFLSWLLTLAYDAAILGYKVKPTITTGPLRNMLPVDRYTAKDMYCTMAEWSFLPNDAPKVKSIAEKYFNANKWPNMPIEIELVKRDQYPMSPWNLGPSNVTYLVKFNFMYLSPDTVPQGFREQIEAHLKGLWDAFRAEGLEFKGHWGKVNFTTPEDVKKTYGWNAFEPLIAKPMVNPYLNQKLFS